MDLIITTTYSYHDKTSNTLEQRKEKQHVFSKITG